MGNRNFYYQNYLITEFIINGKREYLVQLDTSWHPSLTSAQCHIDYITK